MSGLAGTRRRLFVAKGKGRSIEVEVDVNRKAVTGTWQERVFFNMTSDANKVFIKKQHGLPKAGSWTMSRTMGKRKAVI